MSPVSHRNAHRPHNSATPTRTIPTGRNAPTGPHRPFYVIHGDGPELCPGRMISIDFETFSTCNIKKAGSWRYALDPTTELLIMRWSADEGETVHEWREGDPPPYELFKYIRKGYTFRAWNSEFERAIWDHVCVPALGWEPIPFELWADTMALAYTHALPGKLEKCAKALKLKIQKNTAGSRLITKFSKPRKPSKNNPSTRNRLADHPSDADLFSEYCADDVKVECAIFAALPRPRFRVGEGKVWQLTNRINEHGIKLDKPAIDAVQDMLNWYKEKRLTDLRELTNDEVNTDGQREKALAWLETRGCVMSGYTKEDVAAALQFDDLDPKAREFLLIRQELSQISTKKYDTMQAVMWNSRTHNNMVYHRATTGRNGGSGLQMHNFPRDAVSKSPEIINLCIDYIKDGDYESVITLFGNPLDVAKGLLRSMVIPDNGKILYCADFSSVENIVTVWICQDKVGLDVFASGQDQYKAFSAKQFRIPIEEVTDEQRYFAKATILGSMFGAGWKTVYATNASKGVPMTEEQAQQNVAEFRAQYSVTARSWYEIKDKIIEAVDNPGSVQKYKGLKFSMQYGYLWIRLHSGRLLAYYNPKNEWVMAPWKKEIYQTTFWGLNNQQQWVKQLMTPSRCIENIVQATARDLLMYSQDNLNDWSFEILLNVHDEILSQQHPDYMPISEFIEIMVQKPDWTNALPLGLPLRAEGYTAERYRK